MMEFNKISDQFVTSARNFAKQGLHVAGSAVSHAGDFLKDLSVRLDKEGQKLAETVDSSDPSIPSATPAAFASSPASASSSRSSKKKSS